MFERIEQKILDIRQQPESVRMRYLLICLVSTMFFVILIWIFSLKETARDISRTQNIPLPAFSETAKSLESLKESNASLGTPQNETDLRALLEQSAEKDQQ